MNGPSIRVAQSYAAHWPVFPCSVDKKPLTPNGFKDASRDSQEVARMWSQNIGASIGVPTGGESGFFVLDVDLPDGPATLADLEAKHGKLPETLRSRTGSGGTHYLFKMPAGRTVRNSASKIGAGLDVRGDGGYFIVPPSLHPSGKSYTWLNKGTPIAEAPEWLLDLIAQPVRPESPGIPVAREQKERGSSPYGRRALEEEAAKVASAPEGCRNDSLFRSTAAVGELVAGGEIGRGDAEAALSDAATRAGLPDSEARKTIASGLQAGASEPRTAPEQRTRRAQASPGASSFALKESGVYCLSQDSEGNLQEEWVCSPLRVIALTRDHEGSNWGRLLEVIDADGIPHRWAMPMSMLKGAGDDLRGELLSLGLEIAPAQKARNRLNEYLTTARPEARAKCVDRLGWHGVAYVLPEIVFGQDEQEEIVLQGCPAGHAFHEAGELKDWQDNIGRYCVGNSRLTFAVSCAFAAPLLHLADLESGGVNVFGGSSLGKTTALKVAGSVWGGGGLTGFIKSWRATDNALEGTALAHCDALLCLDEMGQVDGRTAAATAYMLANGQGKARANREGSAKQPKEWRILFLSTGEIVLADKIEEDGKGSTKAGQAVRIVDIPADAGAGLGVFENIHGFEGPAAFARHLGEQVKAFYGTPIRAFLKTMLEQREEAVTAAKALVREFVQEQVPAGSDGQVERVAARFGLAAAGGEFAILLGVLPWPEGEAKKAAARCFTDWLETRGGTGAAEVSKGIAQVRQFFQSHGASRFATWGEDPSEEKTINRAGFRKLNASGEWEYFVPVASFKSEIAKGQDAKRLSRELATRGFIISGLGGPSSSHRVPGLPVAKYYHFAPSIVVGED